MKLSRISKITGRIELVTGLHIGSGNNEMHIGGTDNPVLKNPMTNEPYIPGSSLKGKMRSLLEWLTGAVAHTDGSPLGFRHLPKIDAAQREACVTVLKLFGGAPEGNGDDPMVKEIGPTRLAFWDCSLSRDWVAQAEKKRLVLTETKMENMIDRIRGVAEHPRNTERVPAGAVFDFALSLRVHDDENLLDMVLVGFKLLELSGLGGSGSRGYGKIAFRDLAIDGSPLSLDDVQPFAQAA